MSSSFTRRRFLQTSAALGAATLIIPRRAWGANERLNVACIGVTGRGGEDMDGVGENPDVQIVALCDVDEKNLGVATKKHPGAKRFIDYREMLDKMNKEIDAVVVGTPDHHHAPATIRALRLGKHVYCEKPLTHTVAETRKIREAAKQAKVATQMGTQIHAEENYRRVVELIKSGAIGTVTRSHVWVDGGENGGYSGGDRPTDTPPVPEGVHWDLWLGAAPERPYSPKYHPFWWRGWWDFGGGTLADMACHHMDLSHWALDLREPVSIQAEGPPDHPESTPKWLIVNYMYPARGNQPPVHLTWYHGGKRPAEFAEGKLPKWGGAGTLFVGDKGMLIADYGRHQLLPEADFKGFKAPAKSIPKSIGHHNEWVRACREGTPTTCNFDYSGALTETVLLGNVAYRTGKKLEWDAASGKVTNTTDADKFLAKAYRKGWEV